MAHYNGKESVKTEKSRQKKQRAKQGKSLSLQGFIVPKIENPAVVVETSFKEVKVFNSGQMFKATLSKNLPCNKVLFPGDRVKVEDGVVTAVQERKSTLSRGHRDGTRVNAVLADKIVATNVDVAVIVVAAKEPPLHPRFIDRYLIVLQGSGIEPIICLNKADLMTESDSQILSTYEKLGIKVVKTSTKSGEGIEELKALLKGKDAIFVGNSGVGKSSLTNAIANLSERTQNVGIKSGRGRHTTTTSKYFVWDKDSSIIDTPGIRALDVSGLSIKDIQNFFTEFAGLNCKYRTCDHVHIDEKDCAVKQAVSSGRISKLRYESYAKLVEENCEKK